MTQLRYLIDRVLRLKGEQDDLAKGIREIYAEAKASGFDKTAMGQLVAYLRKREKDPATLEENGAIFDIYLTEYDRGTVLATRAHAHEDQPAHDPSTGELIDETPESHAQGVGATAPVADGEPVTGDAGETTGEVARNKFGASPTVTNPASPPCEAEAEQGGRPARSSVALQSEAVQQQSSHSAASQINSKRPADSAEGRASETAGEGGPGLIQPIITSSADPGDIPAFLRRGDPACVVAA